MTRSGETVRSLQERAARALPAERVEDAGGWWLRHAPRCPWWAGSVGLIVRPGRTSWYAGSLRRTRVDVADRLSREWFDGWLAVHGPGDPQAEWDLLARVEQPSGYARARIGDEVVAVGRVVVDTGWACAFHYRNTRTTKSVDDVHVVILSS